MRLDLPKGICRETKMTKPDSRAILKIQTEKKVENYQNDDEIENCKRKRENA